VCLVFVVEGDGRHEVLLVEPGFEYVADRLDTLRLLVDVGQPAEVLELLDGHEVLVHRSVGDGFVKRLFGKAFTDMQVSEPLVGAENNVHRIGIIHRTDVLFAQRFGAWDRTSVRHGRLLSKIRSTSGVWSHIYIIPQNTYKSEYLTLSVVILRGNNARGFLPIGRNRRRSP